MVRVVGLTMLIGVLSSAAFAQPPKRHLFIFKTEHEAQQHCTNDTVVWADTRTHVLYLPKDRHYGHSHGGYVCETQARALGYHAPTTHA